MVPGPRLCPLPLMCLIESLNSVLWFPQLSKGRSDIHPRGLLEGFNELRALIHECSAHIIYCY